MSEPSFRFEVKQKEDGRYYTELKDFNLNFDDVATADQFAAALTDACNEAAGRFDSIGKPQWSCPDCGNTTQERFEDVKYHDGDADVACMECGNLGVEESPELALHEMAKRLDSLRDAVLSAKKGSCWCPAGIDDPNMNGSHTKACDLIRVEMGR